MSDPSRDDTDVVGARIGAELIDNVVMFVLYFAVYVPFVGVGAVLGSVGGDAGGAAALGGSLVGVVLASLSLFLYNFLLEGWWNGQTLGKRALDLEVVQEDGSPVTPAKAAVRAVPLLAMSLFGVLGLVGGLLAMPFFAGFLLVGIVSIAISDRRQRVFDRLAGTLVVRA